MAYYRVFHRNNPVASRADSVEEVRTGVTPGIMVANLIYVLLTILETVLLIRFLLSLGGANRANSFANFIYSLSRPFVAPFRGLFSIHSIVGNGSRFEYEVLIAMLVYAVAAAIVVMIIRSFMRPLAE